MKQLTVKERAAKFAIKPPGHGLRSKGNRKLTAVEQRDLFNQLSIQKPEKRLDSLRILREAISSTSPAHKDRQLELDVYTASARESITQKKWETLIPILKVVVSLSSEAHWATLYVISLANARQFHEAYNWCRTDEDARYVRCVVANDNPLRMTLTDSRVSELSQLLMTQLDTYFTQLETSLSDAFRHPATKVSTKPGI